MLVSNPELGLKDVTSRDALVPSSFLLLLVRHNWAVLKYSGITLVSLPSFGFCA